MKSVLVLLALLAVTQALVEDEAFMSTYKVKVNKRGTMTDYPRAGDNVKVHYTGRLLNGQKFDSSKDRNSPFQFKVGVGQVIRCWDEVILKLTIGDSVTVICPANYAYGSRGAGSVIPPNSDLEFEIEMLGFRDLNSDL